MDDFDFQVFPFGFQVFGDQPPVTFVSRCLAAQQADTVDKLLAHPLCLNPSLRDQIDHVLGIERKVAGSSELRLYLPTRGQRYQGDVVNIIDFTEKEA